MSDDLIERAFCTTRQAANLLGVSVGTVQLWAESGVLRAWKTAGGHRRVLRDSVDQLLRKPPAETSVPVAPATVPARTRPIVTVVEDDTHLLRLYEARISRWPGSPQVLCFDNAVLALLRMGLHRPDLLIIDLHMPGMDGFRLLHCLRQAPEFGDLPIAVVTGMDPLWIEAQGGLPADIAVFPKPVPFDALLKVWSALRDPAPNQAPAQHGQV